MLGVHAHVLLLSVHVRDAAPQCRKAVAVSQCSRHTLRGKHKLTAYDYVAVTTRAVLPELVTQEGFQQTQLAAAAGCTCCVLLCCAELCPCADEPSII